MTSVYASESFLLLGIRGGFQTPIPTLQKDINGTAKPAIGGSGMVDLRYAYYGDKINRSRIGGTFGLALGFGNDAFKGTKTDLYQNYDYEGDPIDYTIHSKYHQSNQVFKLQLSLMLAIKLRQLTINIGPRYMKKWNLNGRMTINESSIGAYFPTYGVLVTNEMVTGRLDVPYKQDVTPYKPQDELLLALEIGYEWSFRSKKCIGLQAYADVGIWNKERQAQTILPLVQVEPIRNPADPIPDISINSLDGQLRNLRHMEFGIRLYYSLWMKEHPERRRSGSYDSRYHYNRFLWR